MTDRRGERPGRNPGRSVGHALAKLGGERADALHAVEPGPGPVVRAAAGVFLGAACGVFTLVVLPRRHAAAGTTAGPP